MKKGFSAVRVPHYLQFEAMSRNVVMGDLSVKPVVVDRLELASIFDTARCRGIRILAALGYHSHLGCPTQIPKKKKLVSKYPHLLLHTLNLIVTVKEINENEYCSFCTLSSFLASTFCVWQSSSCS